jgi:pimeloyl-ACP methyl ester carboxylesterase
VPWIRRVRVLPAIAAIALLLAACGGQIAPLRQPTQASPDLAAGIDQDLLPFYSQTVDWTACGTGFECARVSVPMDYADPSGKAIKLSVKRTSADDPTKRIGSLLINPGGPGGSGISLVESAASVFSPEVMAAYDVVGFDPRGVGDSAPIACISDAELDTLRSAVYDLGSDVGIAALTADMTALGKACEENTGPLLGVVDTVSAARDLDILRAAVGDPQLHYLGYSYGTALGAKYADLFPDRVGRLVLDGAVDPAIDFAELGYGQAAGFESALRAYMADCLAGAGCPFTGTVDDGVRTVQNFLDSLVGSPLPTGTDRALTQPLGFSGILLTLYDNAYWPYLSEAMTAAMRSSDGSQLLYFADLVADRAADGTYTSNSTFAFFAINCLDYPVNADPEFMAAEAARLVELSPTFGKYFSYGEITCDVWPEAATGTRQELHAMGAAPILVVGTTNDPATPYQWAVSMADQLESGHLLTFKGEGHTAYGRSNQCITDAVDGYLLRGDLPPDNQTC